MSFIGNIVIREKATVRSYGAKNGNHLLLQTESPDGTKYSSDRSKLFVEYDEYYESKLHRSELFQCVVMNRKYF